ncbi:hypothetical protein AVEN_195210-1 [Araneus ventricosus]|uniref:Ig-like domain-containing protein n=1 Tax=Araneus ventricosus TaxID=182803 RepID=A0A4Y2G4I3_ARAVE|nr:hypothetical protein AVEN_195210-1 [Araneus ventricosus]
MDSLFVFVIKQQFDPQVYDDFVVRGNTAVLRCHLPTFVREYVSVDSWIREDKQVLKRNDMKGSSYTVLNSGELLIHGVLEKDSQRTFHCQTRHRLTGEMVMSVSAGKIVVTGKEDSNCYSLFLYNPYDCASYNILHSFYRNIEKHKGNNQDFCDYFWVVCCYGLDCVKL